MYSLCIDINNKLFTGNPYFASCQVWSINFNLQRFHMNISSRKSNCSSSSELLSSSISLRISFVQSSKLPLFCSSLFSLTSFLYRSNTETFFEVESIRCKQWQEFQGHRPCMRGDPRCLESATVTLASLNIEVVSVPANMTSRQNCHCFVPRYSHSQVSCTVPTLKHSSRWSRFDANSDRNFKGTGPVCEGIRDA